MVFNVSSCLGLVVALVSFVPISCFCWFWSFAACAAVSFLVVGVCLVSVVVLCVAPWFRSFRVCGGFVSFFFARRLELVGTGRKLGSLRRKLAVLKYRPAYSSREKRSTGRPVGELEGPNRRPLSQSGRPTGGRRGIYARISDHCRTVDGIFVSLGRRSADNGAVTRKCFG